MKLSPDDCSVLPCKGIIADVVKYKEEDFPFEKVLTKYREYKAGEYFYSKVMVTYNFGYRSGTKNRTPLGKNTF